MSCPPLLTLLADGQIHSGEALAQRLKMTRTGVWKGIERLRAQHVEIHAVARVGYNLPQAVELLDAARIKREIGAARLSSVKDLQVHFELPSTNSYLLEATSAVDSPTPNQGARICLTELQTAGRGRRGRPWLAPFGGGIALSIAWRFNDTPRDLPALSLAVGVGITRGLKRMGIDGVQLKWPNDIWIDDRKLGGVLIELRAEAGGPATVVIGIGLNVNLPRSLSPQIERSGVAPANLSELRADVSRNATAGAVIDEVLGVLAEFANRGFAPFRNEWIKLDALAERRVNVLLGEQLVAGIAGGIAADGAFILKHVHAKQETRFISGEVSLRLEDEEHA